MPLTPLLSLDPVPLRIPSFNSVRGASMMRISHVVVKAAKAFKVEWAAPSLLPNSTG